MKNIDKQVEVKKTREQHGMKGTKFYQAWQNMKARCNNQSHSSFKNYGGRGITYCERWGSFLAFKDDMLASYMLHAVLHGIKDTSLDRINNNADYSVPNCQWSTRVIQANNKRNNLAYNSETAYCASRRLGGSRTLVSMRIHTLGWDIERAFTTPKPPSYG